MLSSPRAPNIGALSLLLGLGIVLAVGSIVLTFYPIASVIVIRADGRGIFSAPLEDTEGFTYVFRHSVERTIVKEFYTIGAERSLVLTETAQQSFGAGLPSDADAGMEFRDGFFIFAINREVELFSIMVSAIAEQRIEINGRTVSLSHLPDGTLVTAHTTRIPLVWLRLKGVLH